MYVFYSLNDISKSILIVAQEAATISTVIHFKFKHLIKRSDW